MRGVLDVPCVVRCLVVDVKGKDRQRKTTALCSSPPRIHSLIVLAQSFKSLVGMGQMDGQTKGNFYSDTHTRQGQC